MPLIRFFIRHWLITLIVIILIVLVASVYLLSFNRPMNWGVTFSETYARDELGLDSHETYLAILDDLKVDRIRLSAYWDEIEVKKGQPDFTDLDWLINQASQRHVKIILAVGRRLPRWPECHDPSWIAGMNPVEVDQDQLAFVSAVAKRYVNNPNIIYWQVENEPFLSTFGVCPAPSKQQLEDEISAVKQITKKPILVTDSGELSTWWDITHVGGDILGSTLYRVVYNPYIGYFRWFTPPFFYWSRVWLVEHLTPVKKVIVAELQAEAWHKAGETLPELSASQLNQSMSLQQFKDNINFTRRAGFDEAYLWGVEWWYYMKVKRNDPSYWNEAKKLW